MGRKLRREADDVVGSENSQADDGNGELRQSNQGVFSRPKHAYIHLLLLIMLYDGLLLAC